MILPSSVPRPIPSTVGPRRPRVIKMFMSKNLPDYFQIVAETLQKVTTAFRFVIFEKWPARTIVSHITQFR